jgi:hypothetical protein
MKSTFFIMTWVVLLIAAYIYLDHKLYYAGKNNFSLYGSLPLKIKPIFRHQFEGGIYIAEEEGMSLVYIGENRYFDNDIRVNVDSIVKYGYKSDEFVVYVHNINEKYGFIRFTKNNDHKSKREFYVDLIDIIPERSMREYHWVELNKIPIDSLSNSRRFVFLTLIFTIPFMAALFIFRKKQAPN